MIFNKKKPQKALRRIFFGVPYTEEEKKWIEKFKAEIKKHKGFKLPDDWGDEISLTYIYASEVDLPKSFQRLEKHEKWYSNFFPLNFAPKDRVWELLNCGFCYCFGRDKRFRPLLVVQPYIFKEKSDYFSEQDLRQATIFLCEFVQNNMLIPGQIENWIMIVNCQDMSFLSFPSEVKRVIGELSDNFLSKLYRSYFFNMTKITHFLYKILCAFLEDITVRKFVEIEKGNKNVIFDSIRRDNLEKKFGGEADDLQYNVPNSLFPPRMPSENFILENENKKDILINDSEYAEKIKDPNFPKKAISPFFLEKTRKNEQKMKNEKKEREMRKMTMDVGNIFKGIKWCTESSESELDTEEKIYRKGSRIIMNRSANNMSLEKAILNFNRRKTNFSSEISSLLSK